MLKAYSTRVGEGPLPTELNDETGEFLRARGNEYGTSTGRPRRTGWFDAVVARAAVELSGADAMAITKLDVLDDLDEIPVCVSYRLDGRDVSDVPPLVEDLARVEPRLETLRGWKSNTTAVTRFADLPSAAKDYVRFLEERSGAPAVPDLHRASSRRDDLARGFRVLRGAPAADPGPLRSSLRPYTRTHGPLAQLVRALAF